jgi:hypothetical protein
VGGLAGLRPRALVDRVGLLNTAAHCGIDLKDGAATKYLKSYLGWRRMTDREGDNLLPWRSVACALR